MMMNGKIKQLTPSMMTWTGTFGLMLIQQQQQKYRQINLKEKVLPLEEQIPKEFHDFLDVFSEEKAARFPESRPWDHKIELKDTFTLNPSKRIT